MMNRILLDTARLLKNHCEGSKLRQLCLTRYFTAVQLEDGSVGACMSHYRLPDHILDRVEPQLLGLCQEDIFVFEDQDRLCDAISHYFRDDQQMFYLLTSLTASIVSALSVNFIQAGGDRHFTVVRRHTKCWPEGAESALVVGIGGHLGDLAAQSNISRIHIVDFRYSFEPADFTSHLCALRAANPNKKITIADSVKDAAELRMFDVISITGSALSNGTLEILLENARSDAYIVLYGQSACIHPGVLFESGVRWVATTLKPKSLLDLASSDRTGVHMRPLLDGGLPIVHLLPRSLVAVE